jgi:hypothetical protein
MLNIESRQLAFILGLGDLAYREPCMSYVNACVCDRCLDRASRYNHFVDNGVAAANGNNKPVSIGLAAKLAKDDSDDHFSRSWPSDLGMAA